MMNSEKKLTAAEIREEADRYVTAHAFLTQLRDVYRQLTAQQFKTLRGQALSGDIEGATLGLEHIIGRTHTVKGVRG